MTIKLIIVGEAYNENEVKLSHPFVGKAGFALYQMLLEAGFPLSPLPEFNPGSLVMREKWRNSSIALTNVFMEQPKENKLDHFLSKKKAIDSDTLEPISLCLDLPPVRPGLYLRSEYRPHLDRLFRELEKLSPNLIIAVGNTACWALLQTTKISTLRGTIVSSPFGKVLPVYHPAAVLRNWELRPITVTDFFKAKREMETPNFVRKRREIWVEPEISDLWRWWEKHGKNSDLLSFDIETEKYSQISEIGFASDSTHALHLPFIVERTKSYWKTAKLEAQAWKFVRHVLNSPIPKLAQNGLYDMQFLWCKVGIPTRNYSQDTMLLRHALFPGMPKSLGFLGSIYTDEPSWKTLRREGNKDDE